MTAPRQPTAPTATAPAAGGMRWWPLRPLLDACGLTASALARELGVGGQTIAVASERGLSDLQADEWAIRLGFHPLVVWGWAWVDDADHAAGRPAFVRVAAELRGQIARGELRPGDTLPPVQALARRFGAHSRSVTQAVDELRAEGLLAGGGGRGLRTRVAPGLTAGAVACVVCGQPIEDTDVEHYPHRPHCTLAAHGWCDCAAAAHPECCPTCAAGAA